MIPPKPKCVLCSDESLTHKRPNSAHLKQDERGLTCTKCLQFACNACLKVVLEKAFDKNQNDNWCMMVGEYLRGNPASSQFVGHCCEWLTAAPNQSTFQDERRFDGYLFLPEYAIMISPNFKGVDIHAFGGDNANKLPPVLHGVVDEDLAVQCKFLNIFPDRSASEIVDLYTRQIFDEVGFSLKASIQSTKMESQSRCYLTLSYINFQVNVIVFRPVGSNKVQAEKGMHPKITDLKHAFSIDDNIRRLFPVKGDYLLLIGLTKFNSKHCLLLRQYENLGTTINVGTELRQEIMPRLKKNKGIEAIRRGGSSGCAKVTEAFIAFQNSNVFPRKASGVKLVRQKKGWTAVYVKPFDKKRSAASFSFGQPQIGGVVHKAEELVEQHLVLQQFVLFKMMAPCILNRIDPGISPSAVIAQIQQNNAAFKLSSTLQEQIIEVSKMNNFTYVQHPVGYHIDTFKKNKPVLENKICFVDTSVTNSTGRGGAGRCKFVWALLDW